MMRTVFWALAFILAVVAMGCGKVINDGDVYDRVFIAQHDVEVDDSTSIDMGNGISMPIISSHTETIPDQYFIYFRKLDEESGDWLTNYKSVSKEIFDSFQIGDPISFQ